MPSCKYFALIGLKYSAISFNSSKSKPVSLSVPWKALTILSVAGWEVPPDKGDIAVSIISAPASTALM